MCGRHEEGASSSVLQWLWLNYTAIWTLPPLHGNMTILGKLDNHFQVSELFRSSVAFSFAALFSFSFPCSLTQIWQPKGKEESQLNIKLKNWTQ